MSVGGISIHSGQGRSDAGNRFRGEVQILNLKFSMLLISLVWVLLNPEAPTPNFPSVVQQLKACVFITLKQGQRSWLQYRQVMKHMKVLDHL